MENYIVINGKKAELTKEQLIALGIEIEKNDPFELKETEYYFITTIGSLGHDFYCNGCLTTEGRHAVANYCADKDLMIQRALHETLNRLLWRYSMQHDGDKIDWSDACLYKHKIHYNTETNLFYVGSNNLYKEDGTTYFFSRKIAEAAIKEVVEPFMKQHPNFKW